MTKIISHWELRYNPKYARKCSAVPVNTEKRLVITDEYDEKSCRVIRKSELKTIDRKKEMEIYRCSDFSLENMLSAGVTLQPVNLSSTGFSLLDNIETQVQKIADNLKNNVESL